MCENVLRIAFRVDANQNIGLGHVMRCQTIIKVCLKRRIQCTFYTTSEIVEEKGSEMGIEVLRLNSISFSMCEAQLLKHTMKKRNEEILFIDSYDVTEQYLEELHNIYTILLVDNQCDLFANMIIQPNAYLQEQGKVQKTAIGTYLKGMEYQPIREEFFLNQVILREEIENILILTGGTFYENFVLSLLTTLFNHFCTLNVTVLTGARLGKDAVKKIEDQFSHWNLEIVCNVSNVAEIMKKNDIAISACGSTIYEIMAIGLPVVAFSMAENQRVTLEVLRRDAGIIYAGEMFDAEIVESILKGLDKLKNIEQRKQQVRKMREVIKANGAERIVFEICEHYFKERRSC